jgi:hypothetical protein
MSKGQLTAAWGLTGFSLLILTALYRLTPMAVEALLMPLSTLQWLALALNVLFMAYSEGYRGFQKSFSPKLANRLDRLIHSGTNLERWLAPLYCMGYFNAQTRQLIITYSLTLLIIIFVMVFHLIPQPWRGVLDAGVVVGLAWGLVATWAAVFKVWPGRLTPSSERAT